MNTTFNNEQQRVIAAQGGFHLVLAPPGCGKTAVLAERIVRAREQGVPFGEMACLTFTNRAARSMRERILQRMPQADGVDELFVGNIHRFCLHYLFDNALVPGHATVIDTDTSMSIIADSLGDDELRVLADNRLRQQYSDIINLQHLMYQCREHHPAGIIIHREAMPSHLLRELCLAFGLSYSQQSTVSLYMQADDYLHADRPLSTDARMLLRRLYAARQYERYKQQNDLLDFEDLLLGVYEATGHEKPVKAFRWLQIDEVQDLNPLQMAIVDRLTTADATVVYLGDAQQAIFSFMGAKTDTLTMLRQRCGDNFYNFCRNYRSPRYLLDIFNTFGSKVLGIDPALLPSTDNLAPRRAGDVELIEAATSIDEANMVARRVSLLYDKHPDETIAVVVAFNADADEVSAALKRLPHFKVSGADFFASTPMRLLLAHLGVVAMEHDFIGWANLLAGLKVYASNSAARQAVRAMMQLAMSPADMLRYEQSTYVAQFVQTYEQADIVVFDTETTGLDVFADDVVQLAAVRTRQGRVVDSLNLFIATDRPIPPMLGDTPNPLTEEYGRHPHLAPAEAMERFAAFAQGAVLLGHNATFDCQIMEHNMHRHAPRLDMKAQWVACIDTLKLAHLLHPRMKSYKLRHLLQELQLEGQNSHLADDDIMATLNLATDCYGRGRSIVGRQLEFLARHRQTAQRLQARYGELYRQALGRLHAENGGQPLVDELRSACGYFRMQGAIDDLPKLEYVLRYIGGDLLTPDSGRSLAQQLARHYAELCTMKEADLCGAKSMTERVFVSTVHKAKGLEFDTVVVYDAVAGKYPSAFASTAETRGEEARKFYVALSRARKRLIVSYCHQSVTRWGRTYERQLTPYMDAIRDYF